jgi:exodeoxyribonuclease-3
MRIVTWNVNGLRARLDFLLHFLRERRPDVVAMQELKLEEDQFPHEELGALGYRAAIHGQKAWNGVALISREEPVVTQRGLPGQEEMGARLITAEIGDLLVTSIYVPNGKTLAHEDYPRKLAWLDALASHFEATQDPGRPMLLGGDFNVCPEPIDSWNEKKFGGSIFHTDEERARIARLKEWGFVDAFRDRHPDEATYSWWDYRMGAFHRGWGLRIDLWLATPAAMARVTEVGIDREYRKKKDGLTASDHAPVILEVG